MPQMDRIYQRTRLGDSLLRTLETLCQEGTVDGAEARRIVGDFDEVGQLLYRLLTAACVS